MCFPEVFARLSRPEIDPGRVAELQRLTAEHAKQLEGSADGAAIASSVADLSALLDLGKPWTLVLLDPTGRSKISPMDGVKVSPGLAPMESISEAEDAAKPDFDGVD